MTLQSSLAKVLESRGVYSIQSFLQLVCLPLYQDLRGTTWVVMPSNISPVCKGNGEGEWMRLTASSGRGRGRDDIRRGRGRRSRRTHVIGRWCRPLHEVTCVRWIGEKRSSMVKIVGKGQCHLDLGQREAHADKLVEHARRARAVDSKSTSRDRRLVHERCI